MSAAAISFATCFDGVSRGARIADAAQRTRPGPVRGGDAAAVRELRERLAAQGVTAARLADALGLDAELVAAFLAGDDAIDAASRAGLLAQVRAWIDEHDAEASSAAAVGTRVVALVRGVVTTIRTTRTIGLMVGASGMGKTHALRTIAATSSDLLMVRAMADERSAMAILGAIGAAAAERGFVPARRRLGTRAAAAAFRKHGALLVVDEAQVLSAKALETVRGIFDAAGVGVLLVGTRAAADRFAPAADPLLAPLVGRVALRIDLEAELEHAGESWLDLAELVAIIRAADFAVAEDALGLLYDVGTRAPGRLRSAVYVCRVARILAGKTATKIPTPALREAIRAAGLADYVMEFGAAG